MIDEVGELDEFVGEQAVPGGLQVSVVGLGEAQVAEFGEGVVPEAVVGEEGDTLCGGGIGEGLGQVEVGRSPHDHSRRGWIGAAFVGAVN